MEVTLRQVTRDDLPGLYAHQRDPEAYTMAGFTPRDWDAFVLHWTSKVLAAPTGVVRAIELDGVLAGHVVTFDYDGVREVGYWIAREHWGRGVATRALRQLLALDPHRPLHAGIARHNHASARVLEKCGFVRVREDGGEIRFRLD